MITGVLKRQPRKRFATPPATIGSLFGATVPAGGASTRQQALPDAQALVCRIAAQAACFGPHRDAELSEPPRQVEAVDLPAWSCPALRAWLTTPPVPIASPAALSAFDEFPDSGTVGEQGAVLASPSLSSSPSDLLKLAINTPLPEDWRGLLQRQPIAAWVEAVQSPVAADAVRQHLPETEAKQRLKLVTELLFVLLRHADARGPGGFTEAHLGLIRAISDTSPVWVAAVEALRVARVAKGQRVPVTNGFLRQARHVYQRGKRPELYSALIKVVFHRLAPSVSTPLSASAASLPPPPVLADLLPMDMTLLRQAHTFDWLIDRDVLAFNVAMATKERTSAASRRDRWLWTKQALALALALAPSESWSTPLRHAVQAAVFLGGDAETLGSHRGLLAEVEQLAVAAAASIAIPIGDRAAPAGDGDVDASLVAAVDSVRDTVVNYAQLELQQLLRVLRVASRRPMIKSILDALAEAMHRRRLGVAATRTFGCDDFGADAVDAVAAARAAVHCAAEVHNRQRERSRSVHSVLLWLGDNELLTRAEARPFDFGEIVTEVSEHLEFSQLKSLLTTSRQQHRRLSRVGIPQGAGALPNAWTCGCGAPCSPLSRACGVCTTSADVRIAMGRNAMNSTAEPATVTTAPQAVWNCAQCHTVVSAAEPVCLACAARHPWDVANPTLERCDTCTIAFTRNTSETCACTMDDRLRAVAESTPGPLSAMEALGGICPNCESLQPASAWVRRCCASCGDFLGSGATAARLRGEMPLQARAVALSAQASTALQSLGTWECGECATVNLAWAARADGSWMTLPCTECLRRGRVTRFGKHNEQREHSTADVARSYFTWQCGCGARNAPDAVACHACSAMHEAAVWACPSCQHSNDTRADGAVAGTKGAKDCARCGAAHPVRTELARARLGRCRVCESVVPTVTPDGTPMAQCIVCGSAEGLLLRTQKHDAADGPWKCVECGDRNSVSDAVPWRRLDNKPRSLTVQCEQRDPLAECHSCGASRPSSVEPLQPNGWRCATCGNEAASGFECGSCGSLHPTIDASGLQPHGWGCRECRRVNASWETHCTNCSAGRPTDARERATTYTPWRCLCGARNLGTALKFCRECRNPRPLDPCKSCGRRHVTQACPPQRGRHIAQLSPPQRDLIEELYAAGTASDDDSEVAAQAIGERTEVMLPRTHHHHQHGNTSNGSSAASSRWGDSVAAALSNMGLFEHSHFPTGLAASDRLDLERLTALGTGHR